jgi:metal-dependent hydrolase (beta-lactamase superfamily II)
MREVLKEAEEIVEPNIIIGGFHDSDPAEIPDSIGHIILCHCTRNAEEIMKRFGARASIGSAGSVYDWYHCD